MKILHTSDWHLGKKIGEKDTYRGTQAFLDWLRSQIYEQHVDCLIVAGDIFDTTTPTNQAKAQYYQFIASLVGSPCKSVVVVAGNHDSPSLITAPKEVLKHLNVHVVGAGSASLEDEVLEVNDEEGQPAAIIGAVPFLRERDIYRSSEDVSATERLPKVTDAIRNHYRSVYAQALEKRGNHRIPIVLTGHLFADETAVADDEERKGYIVGNLGQVPINVIPQEADYVALGHIHRPQVLCQDETRNYSGAPYQMNFKEAGQKRYVRMVEFPDGRTSVTSIELPQFLRLEQVEGTVDSIVERLKEMGKENEEIFVKVVVDGELASPTLAIQSIKDATKGTKIFVAKYEHLVNGVIYSAKETEDDFSMEMTPENVFEKLLDEKKISGSDRTMLEDMYREVLRELEENPEDLQSTNAEGKDYEN